MKQYNCLKIISEELINDKLFVEWIKDETKREILSKIKDELFTDNYFIIKGVITESNMIDYNKADLYIKGKITFEKVTIKILVKMLYKFYKGFLV